MTECSWGERVYTQLYFHSGKSITKIPSTQSRSAHSKPVSASGPLCLHSHPLGPFVCTAVLHSHPPGLSAGPSHTAVLRASLHGCPTQPSSGPLCMVVLHSCPLGLSLALPPLQPLLCSPPALQPCHRVVPRALGGAPFIESTVMYCPQVCSEVASQPQPGENPGHRNSHFIHNNKSLEATEF